MSALRDFRIIGLFTTHADEQIYFVGILNIHLQYKLSPLISLQQVGTCDL